jgi:hypothetical protein
MTAVAIMVGEFERAFCRDQFVQMLPWFTARQE